MSVHRLRMRVIGVALLSFFGVLAGASWAQSQPVMEAVIGNNFGHLPMFVGVQGSSARGDQR